MAHIDINFISNALGRSVDITLILPSKKYPESNYDAKADTYYQDKKDKLYPLIILLHGYLNDEKMWTRYARAEMYAEENNIAIAMISGENKFYLNWEARTTSDNFYDFVEYELKDYLYGTFPISKRREDNYIAGLSMGGFGALYHGLSHPKAYSAIGAFSAPYKLEDGDDAILIKDLVDSVEDAPFVYVACGSNDFLLQDNTDLVNDLKARNINHYYDYIEGYGHEWRFWDMELEKFIKSLKRSDYYKDIKRGV